MKTELSATRGFPRNERAFTFIEVMVATAITLIMFVTFYAALSSGVRAIQIARENLRATQIMVGRMEGIRLFTWDQLTNTTLMPPSFTEAYYPAGMNGTNSNQGITYTGAVSVAAVTLANPASSYDGNMLQVTIQVQWSSMGVLRQRQMTTYCSKYGVQNYVWTSN